jgi:hypothetical protein
MNLLKSAAVLVMPGMTDDWWLRANSVVLTIMATAVIIMATACDDIRDCELILIVTITLLIMLFYMIWYDMIWYDVILFDNLI